MLRMIMSFVKRPDLKPGQYIKNSFINEDMMDNYRLEDFSEDDIICAGNAYGNSDACQGKLSGKLCWHSIYLKAIPVDRWYVSKKVNQFFKELYPGEFDVEKPFYQVSILVLLLITAG